MSQRLTILRSVCPHDCPDTCSISVTVEHGKVKSVRGDKEHSFTNGFLCHKVSRYQERVYHPERMTTPLRRSGPKGSGQFRPISWNDAINEIASQFRKIAASIDGPQAILPYSYAGTMGLIQGSSLDRRFFHRLGASLLARTICATAGSAGCNISLGTRAFVDPEAIDNNRLIINWGSNTSVTNMHLWAKMHHAKKNGAMVITIDPFQSKTAERSNWWIPIRPGTDAALALGIMHILFRDRLTDDDYLNNYCLGVKELKDRVLTEYTPPKVSRITGLNTADIEELARLYGSTNASLIRLNYGLQRHYGGGMAVRTITCLPAITGAWRNIGSGALLSTSITYPWNTFELERPDLIPPGTRTINMVQLAEALHGELPGPPVKAVYVYNSNPAAVCPDQQRVLDGLKREDLFTVVHDQFQTDTADYADIVLPATTQLEHLDIHGSYGHLYVQLNDPVIEAIGESKPNTEVFRLLAKAMNFEDELFQSSDEELARAALGKAKNYCGPTPEAFEGITVDELRRNGPMRLNVPKDYAPFAKGEFATPSGKCEFYSELQKTAGNDPLPNYTPPAEDPQTNLDLAAQYPLQMLSPPVPSFLNSTFANIASLLKNAVEPTAIIHPQDALPRYIAQGDWVSVRNDRGSFQARAIVGNNVKPGVVICQGIWWNRFTPDGKNCNMTTSTRLTDFGAGATFFDNLVEVEKIAGE